MLACRRKVLVVGEVREVKLGRVAFCCLYEESQPSN